MNAQEKSRQDAALARIPALVARFNGQIKYLPMVLDHPEWSDDECVAFAQKWDAEAIKRYKASRDGWNNGIPYCRNVYKGA